MGSWSCGTQLPWQRPFWAGSRAPSAEQLERERWSGPGVLLGREKSHNSSHSAGAAAVTVMPLRGLHPKHHLSPPAQADSLPVRKDSGPSPVAHCVYRCHTACTAEPLHNACEDWDLGNCRKCGYSITVAVSNKALCL